jgi:hypothetical protein
MTKWQINREQGTIHCRLNTYVSIYYFKASQFHEKSECVISALVIAGTRTARRLRLENKKKSHLTDKP